ncbi:nucleotide disphospho-sugar-binding domain-containing protein [Nonomuraea sp. NPDC046570]|uniref:nucleotide disphospho-sugar-binding domain-containing protein n=1 Tax=Nonomuraea sp. NPDC046570 TaxID=3155255 RepID=UPI0033E05143
MRFLFVTGGGSAPVHSGVPLAWAARAAGHEVILAAPEENIDLLVRLGLPAYGVTRLGIVDAMLKDRQGNWLGMPVAEDQELDFAGRGFARLAAASYPAIVELARSWRPDVVIGGEYNLAAMLLAHQFDLPLVRHTWAVYARTDVDWRGATDELRPELSRLGLDAIPEPGMFIDITPPSIRPKDAEPAQLMRWAPGNPQVPLQPWMYAKGDRPRVVLTSGSRSTLSPALGIDFFRPLLDNPALRDGDVEVVVATSEPVAAQLLDDYPEVKAGFVPLDVLAPTADLVIHHGGGVTVMTVLNAGTPQLVLPEMLASAQPMRLVDEYGASITLPTHTEPVNVVSAAVTGILSDPSFKERALELAAEIAGLPRQTEVIAEIEKMI